MRESGEGRVEPDLVLGVGGGGRRTEALAERM